MRTAIASFGKQIGSWLAIWALVLAFGANAQVLINEVDSDDAGTDNLEFVELVGTPGASLTGLVIVFFNGATDQSYAAFDLDGMTLDVNGLFVLGNSAVVSVDMIFANDLLQNGADAVALYTANATNFPTNTPVTTTNLVDALVYDTSDADDAGLLVLLNAAQPQVDENAGGTGTALSMTRCPDGAGGARNTTGYLVRTPTPGSANDCSVAVEQETWGGVKKRFHD
ncbi:MAG TPA: hypothetical protein VFD07_13060 [Candidatus Krumholzibacteria bacterium]|nr:hypothetical protein [Candidatus Krumholzibacteria bacterium]